MTTAPAEALARLARDLEEEGTLLSDRVHRSEEQPHLGMLVAAGPRAAADPGAYALLFETIREGSLAHFGTPRLLDLDDDPDLALLAGDYLYSRGLERLASLGDLDAVRELADLISVLSERPGTDGENAAWLATAVAVGWGGSERSSEALRELGDGDGERAAGLVHVAGETAGAAGLSDRFAATAQAVGFPSPPSP